MMAKTTVWVRFETVGTDLMRRSFSSVGEVLAHAESDDVDFDVRWCRNKALIDGAEIASVQFLPIQDGIATSVFRPSVGMPLFVAKVMSIVPGSTVRWEKGWPIMSPPAPRDRDSERIPVPTGGNLLPVA